MKRALFDEIYKYTPPKVSKQSSSDYKKTSTIITSQSLYWRHIILISFVFLLFLIFISSLFQIQINNQESYLNLADSNRIREFTVIASRGLLFDRNDNLLVRNRPSFSIQMNPLICFDDDSYDICFDTIDNLNSLIELEDVEFIKEKINAI